MSNRTLNIAPLFQKNNDIMNTILFHYCMIVGVQIIMRGHFLFIWNMTTSVHLSGVLFHDNHACVWGILQNYGNYHDFE